mmetsp:Transcript_10196/g.11106  ORF Transcript_10196/g.11106 Transcript_10196/m.11106 type:complete len:168 (+) Transcript_10196:52-555(+)
MSQPQDKSESSSSSSSVEVGLRFLRRMVIFPAYNVGIAYGVFKFISNRDRIAGVSDHIKSIFKLPGTAKYRKMGGIIAKNGLLWTGFFGMYAAGACLILGVHNPIELLQQSRQQYRGVNQDEWRNFQPLQGVLISMMERYEVPEHLIQKVQKELEEENKLHEDENKN